MQTLPVGQTDYRLLSRLEYRAGIRRRLATLRRVVYTTRGRFLPRGSATCRAVFGRTRRWEPLTSWRLARAAASDCHARAAVGRDPTAPPHSRRLARPARPSACRHVAGHPAAAIPLRLRPRSRQSLSSCAHWLRCYLRRCSAFVTVRSCSSGLLAPFGGRSSWASTTRTAPFTPTAWSFPSNGGGQTPSIGPKQWRSPTGRIRETCPVRALTDWLTAASISGGPLFRPVTRYGSVLPQRLAPRSVARIAKRTAQSAQDAARAQGNDALAQSLDLARYAVPQPPVGFHH